MSGPRLGPVVVVVGAISRDGRDADPRGWRAGGGAIYAAFVLAKLGFRVRALLGAAADVIDCWELSALVARGADVRTVTLRKGPEFDHVGHGSHRRQFARSWPDPINADTLPSSWRDADGVYLCHQANELGDDWPDAFERASMLAVGWQGYVREVARDGGVTARNLQHPSTINRADISVISPEDVQELPLEMRSLLVRDDQQVVVTRGSRGAIAASRVSGAIHYRLAPAFRVPAPVDTVGAGDSFLAAWLAAMLVDRADPSRRLSFATAYAAVSVLRSGPADAPTAAAVRSFLASSVI